MAEHWSPKVVHKALGWGAKAYGGQQQCRCADLRPSEFVGGEQHERGGDFVVQPAQRDRRAWDRRRTMLVEQDQGWIADDATRRAVP